jgi:Transposase DDE domain
MHQKMQTAKAKQMSRIRSRTVEPVLGTLINFLNMKRVNTRGIKQANKHVLMAALCYNLKKLLKFERRNANCQLNALKMEVKNAVKSVCVEFLHFCCFMEHYSTP